MAERVRGVQISEDQAYNYYSLLMCSDPYPGSNEHHSVAEDIGNTIAIAFGYDNWIDHYHEIGDKSDG